MDQTSNKGKSCAQCADDDQTLDQIELAANSQVELCIAALFVLDQSERLQQMQNDPEVLALRGIVGALGNRAKEILQEVEVSAVDTAIRDAFGGAA